MASAGAQWFVVFQVVKTAQSRGRTERTLLKALSQLLWPNKGREAWSRRAGTTKRPAALINSYCKTAYAVISTVRSSLRAVRGSAADRRDPSLLMSHWRLLPPKSSCRQALMLLRWLAADARSSAPVQGQAGPSWQDGADMWILISTLVRFLSRVESGRRFFW